MGSWWDVTELLPPFLKISQYRDLFEDDLPS